MTTIVKAIYEAGILRPLEPLRFAEGQQVDVIVPALAEENGPDPEYIRQLITELEADYVPTGQVETASVDHDHYLYGAPKRS